MLQLFAVDTMQNVATSLGRRASLSRDSCFLQQLLLSPLRWAGNTVLTVPGEGADSPTQDFIVPLTCCATPCSGAEM